LGVPIIFVRDIRQSSIISKQNVETVLCVARLITIVPIVMPVEAIWRGLSAPFHHDSQARVRSDAQRIVPRMPQPFIFLVIMLQPVTVGCAPSQQQIPPVNYMLPPAVFFN